jgi:hypothetical protein
MQNLTYADIFAIVFQIYSVGMKPTLGLAVEVVVDERAGDLVHFIPLAMHSF